MSTLNKGFTFIETIIGMAIMVSFFAAVATILQVSLENVGQARVRAEATNLGQEYVELSRNLPFTEVGTVGGIPAGSLPQSTTVSRNGQDFTVETNVVFIDDPFDDLAPTDIIPTDYKRVTVTVSWSGAFTSTTPIKLWTDVAPRGLETLDDAGTLSILVFDSNGVPITNANVNIQADTVTPPVNLDTLTDSFGRVLLPGAPECLGCYRITATRNGYTTDRTYGTEEVTNPNKPHQSVLESQLTDISFSIDLVSTINVSTVRSSDFSPFPNVQIQLTGAKEIGRTALDEPVYLYDELLTTGPLGTLTVTDVVWDTYTAGLPAASILDMAASSPISPFAIEPNTTTNFVMTVEGDTPNSLLTVVRDENEVTVSSGSVTISQDSPPFIATESVGGSNQPNQGQAFFSNISSGVYDYFISSPFQLDATGSVSVLGDTIDYVQMEATESGGGT